MKLCLCLFAGMLFLSACAKPVNTAPRAIEDYYRTLVARDEARLAGLSCAAWEKQARLDSHTFANFPATAENVQCQEAGTDGNFTIVACTGKLALDYNGDKQEIDLAARQYRAVQEDGAWKMCGYK